MQASRLVIAAAAIAFASTGTAALAQAQVPAVAPVALAPAQSQTVAPGEAAATAPITEINPAGIPFRAGTYRCELNRQVQVREVSPDLQFAVLNWDRKDYTMRVVGTRSGALRYEDSASGLVWLVIASKSMLLDTRRGQQLANECKA